ncbi:MAG: ATP-binding protein [Thermoanaerobaculia bacterium]|nr:ATP-binding protein [Thermoanaerobaculia bacterium]
MTIEFAAGGPLEFRPRARLLKLIGAELISDDVVAITELVKNAHDADATEVRLQFRGVTEAGGQIIITDNGCGMDRHALLSRWMEPAVSWKAGPETRRTPRGRRCLGEKGVGRFAVDKLASHLELVSATAGSPEEIVADFDWDGFENGDLLLHQVQNHWRARPATTLPGQGTRLTMTGLRSSWNERKFRRLSTRLARLRPPHSLTNGLSIVIESDEFPVYCGEVGPGFLDRAPHHLEADFDGRGWIDLKLNHQVSRSRWPEARGLTCGPVRLQIFAFDLETEAIGRLGPRMEVRAWLREWSGISVYRDGFRVWPYGEPHDDWLRLDHRRVNNPVVCLSNNQIVGLVEITADGNPELRDQTNREGLIHTPAFDDLRRFVHSMLAILEAGRQSTRHPGLPRSSSSQVTPLSRGVVDQLETLSSGLKPVPPATLARLARQLRQERQAAEVLGRKRHQGYSELAATGHALVGLNESLTRLTVSTKELKKELETLAGVQRAGAARLLAQMENNLGHIADCLQAVGSARTASSARRTIDIRSALDEFKAIFDPLFLESGISLHLECPPPGRLRVEVQPGTMIQVLSALAFNSLHWLQEVPRPRISIIARATAEQCEVTFSDNGPGIPPEIAPRVFEPLFTTRRSGSGMGLTIARDLVELHGGTVELVDTASTGATFRILLRRKRSRATV